MTQENKNTMDRHSAWIRRFHWINMVSITLLILTGYYIHAPLSLRLFDSMDTARMIHFTMAYVLCFGLLGRIYYAIVAKDTKNILFNGIPDIKNLPSMMKYYLFMTDSHPDYGKYNPGQKMMYTGWFFMALVMIVTGFILYNPDLFASAGGALGGLLTVRLIHYIFTWLWVLTILLHVYLDLSEGVPVLMSMITGKIPEEPLGTHAEKKDNKVSA